MTQATDLGAITNQSRTSYRGRVNTNLQAVVTQHAGVSAPSPTYAGMMWFDTANNLVKIRDQTNTSWASIGGIDPFTWTALTASSGVVESAALSGTDVVLTGVPAGATGFDLSLVAATASGTWNVTLQLGTSAGLVVTGYAAVGEEIGAATIVVTSSIPLALSLPTNAVLIGGFRGFLTTSNRWIVHGISSNITSPGNNNTVVCGTVVLPGALDRFSLGTNSGGNFSGGAYQIRYQL